MLSRHAQRNAVADVLHQGGEKDGRCSGSILVIARLMPDQIKQHRAATGTKDDRKGAYRRQARKFHESDLRLGSRDSTLYIVTGSAPTYLRYAPYCHVWSFADAHRECQLAPTGRPQRRSRLLASSDGLNGWA